MKNIVCYQMYQRLKQEGAVLPDYINYFNNEEINFSLVSPITYYLIEHSEQYRCLLDQLLNVEICTIPAQLEKEVFAEFMQISPDDIGTIYTDRANRIATVTINNQQAVFTKIVRDTAGALHYYLNVDDGERLEIKIGGWQ